MSARTPTTDTIETSLYLLGYDVLKKRPIKFPEMGDVGANVATGAGYEFIGTKVVDWVLARVMPERKMEGAFAGRVLMIPVIESIVRKYLIGAPVPTMGQLFLKSLVTSGVRVIIKQYM
jgi:hypothetical protein